MAFIATLASIVTCTLVGGFSLILIKDLVMGKSKHD
jgi:hypothetical protein